MWFANASTEEKKKINAKHQGDCRAPALNPSWMAQQSRNS
jgi:hypothetical protein